MKQHVDKTQLYEISEKKYEKLHDLLIEYYPHDESIHEHLLDKAEYLTIGIMMDILHRKNIWPKDVLCNNINLWCDVLWEKVVDVLNK